MSWIHEILDEDCTIILEKSLPGYIDLRFEFRSNLVFVTFSDRVILDNEYMFRELRRIKDEHTRNQKQNQEV